MAEGFEPYHVPQQSRRDKLRVLATNHHHHQPDHHHHHHTNLQQGFAAAAAALAPPLYDPSQLISPDYINNQLQHRHSFLHTTTSSASGVKEEGMSLMGFVNANQIYFDPAQLNPSTIQDHLNAGNPFIYSYQNQSFHGHNNEELNSSHNAAVATTGQSLSLSLSSHHSSQLPLELNLQRYEPSMFGSRSNDEDKVSSGGYSLVASSCKGGVSGFSTATASIELCKSAVPLGPFTGYASVLKGSRFLKPAQQLLEELCDLGRGIYADRNGGADSALLDPPPLESLGGNEIVDDDSLNCSDGGERTRKKSRLISMLDEVYKRYKQYYLQMQAAMAAFESVAGLSGAAPFANLALKALSKHFRCLKNAITDQLQFTSKSHGKMNCEGDENTSSGRGSYGQRSFHSSGFVDQPVWRPQRGLPEHAVTVLRAWLFEHFLHPYPTDTDKLMLAKQTGLSRNQVSNWFINARVRLWKPMVEEIHMLETRQGQKSSHRDHEEEPPAPPPAPPSTQNNDQMHASCSIESENASTFIRRNIDFPLKRTRGDEESTTARGSEAPLIMKPPYDDLLHRNPQMRVGPSINGGPGNGGVSLTLGLHQNSSMGLSVDPYPIHAARRFGLDSHGGDGYVVSGFAAQNRQYGRDMIDGHIMHDFVG